MYTDDNNTESDNDKDEIVFFYIINFNNRRWASKPSTSLTQILESGQVLKVDLGRSG